jgi:integrase
MKNNNYQKIIISLSHLFGTGGDIKECNILNNLGLNVECQSQNYGKDMVKDISLLESINVNRIRGIDNSKLLFPRILDFNKYDSKEELFNDIIKWWTETKHKALKTIITRIRCARQFSNHKIYPIDWLKFDEQPEQIINLFQYLLNFEYKEKGIIRGNPNYGINHLHNLKKTVNTFAKAKGIDVTWWDISLPEQPENKVKKIPNPITVNKLIHNKYCNDKYENALIKTILITGFFSGVRPEELITLKVENIDFENGLIVITEQKKRYRNRQIRLEKSVMYSRQQPSLKNYI